MSLSDTDIAACGDELRRRRGELEALIAASEEGRDAVALDQTKVGRLSRMDALQGQAMAQETHRRRRSDLQRIDAALGRIADGVFGDCLRCGEEIERRRLDFDPASPLCIDCARGG